ncbi:MAG: crossover junction endodeoxyribonuclease RuvC [Spirochaetales bacterium]|nr:crossover junction endodeoxyribonuclease RuvC [Spirochaetales bacterium]
MRVVIGIDPGLQNTGYGIVGQNGNRFHHIEHGTIITSSDQSVGDRLRKLFHEIKKLIKRHNAGEAGIEDIYFAKNAKSLIPVASAKGVLMLACAECGIPVTEYSPLVIKRAVTGNGRAEKQQIQEIVRLILGLSNVPSPDHAADALAVAICLLQQQDFEKLVEKSAEKKRRSAAERKPIV